MFCANEPAHVDSLGVPPDSEPDLPAPAHFSPALFAFLGELSENNDRAWFTENKTRYERDLREPAIRFILDFGPRLQSISPHFRADPRKSGGSLFRIHRDVRFSTDKSPYKTYTGIQFRHEAGKSAHAPGFYLHLEPKSCFVGVGIWRPDSPTIKAIRQAIVDDPSAWQAASGDTGFANMFELRGERLKRVPRGFDAAHPLAEDLKWKDHIGVVDITPDEVTDPDFMDRFNSRCVAATPYVSWLCAATAHPF